MHDGTKSVSVPPTVPDANIEVYRYVFAVETILRELLIETLESLDGPQWYKQRLPKDILDKYENARAYERKTPWTTMTLHHPIYYVDFPDLKKVLERDTTWNSAMRPIFGQREMLTGVLTLLEPIRNKVAHNRRASDRDALAASDAFIRIYEAVGEKHCNRLLSRCTSAPGLLQLISELGTEFTSALGACLTYEALPPSSTWRTIGQQWWFDETYLGVSLEPVQRYLALMQEYADLSRRQGTGHLIERWVKTHDLHTAHVAANNMLQHLLAERG